MSYDGTYTYIFDAENRLTEAKQGAVTVGTYSYDPLGRRSEKTAAGLNTEYMYAGANIIAEYDGGTGDLMRRYVYGPGLDDPIAMLDEAGTVTYFHGDGRGTIIALSSGSTGSVIDKFTHGPFGELDTNTGGSAYKFTARRIDEETGLYYYRNRYYHPEIGRFMSADPIGYGDGLNIYAYVGNDPVNNVDPWGLCAETLVEKINADGETEAVCPGGSSGGTTPGTTTRCPADGPLFCHTFLQQMGFEQLLASLSTPPPNVGSLGFAFGGNGPGGAIVKPPALKCAGIARVLSGNSNFINKKKGAFGITIRSNTAAIISRQFTGEKGVGPKLRGAGPLITGSTNSGQTFFGLSDQIDDLGAFFGATNALRQDQLIARELGKFQATFGFVPAELFIIEITGGTDEGITNIELFIPRFFADEFGCPVGLNPVP